MKEAMIIETVKAEPKAPRPPTETIIDMIYNPVLDNEELFPASCKGCKLLDRFKEGFNSCHAVAPRYDLRKLPEAKGTILIIVPPPGEKEDKCGHPLTTYSGGAFLNSFISNLDNHWVVANAVGCYAGKDGKGKKIKLGRKEAANCQDAYVRALIRELAPKVVVFLGMDAMNAVLGPHAPKTLGKALGDPIKFPENDYFIIGAEDPVVHQTQRKDLEKPYLSLFQQADRLCNGDYHEETVEYELVTTTSRLKELSRSLQERICLDTEDDRNIGRNLKPEHKKKSVWHLGVKMILLQISERVDTFYDPYKIKNYVFVPELLTKENIIALIRNRILVGHNIKHDLQAVFALKGVDCYKYIKGYICTFLQFVAMDQGQSGNGLKERSRLHFNINAWETEAERDRDVCNKAISDSYALIDQLIKDEEKKIKDADKIAEKQAKADVAYKKKLEKAEQAYGIKLAKWQEVEDKNERRKLEGAKPLKVREKPEPFVPETIERKVYDEVDLSEVAANLERLKAARAKLRPIGDANFGDITTEILHYYGACDVHYGLKIQDEVLDQYKASGSISATCMELNDRNIYTTSYMERWGVCMDMDRHRILSNLIDLKITTLKDQIIQNRFVMEALSNTPDIAKLVTEGKLTYDYLVNEAIKPNKKKFLAQLLLVTGVLTEHSPQTKSSGLDNRPIEYKINTEVLDQISGGEDDCEDLFKQKGWAHSEDKNEVQWLWYYIWSYRKLLGLQSKFLKNLKEYAVDNRLHPDFILGRIETGKGAQGTITGRLATSNPNILNLKKDKALRWCFPARLNPNLGTGVIIPDLDKEESWLLEIDYVSQEIVLASVVTGCKAWQYMFKNNLDIYSCVANDLYGGGIDIYGDPDTVRAQLKAKYPKEGPGSAIRTDCKTSTLGILFCQSAWEFANRTGISLKKVEAFYEQFDKKYPEVKEYKKSIEAAVANGEMIENLFGLRRSTRLQRTGDSKHDRKNFARMVRQLVNFKIQSLAAGQSGTLAYFVVKWILDGGFESQIQANLQVHDSLTFTVSDKFLEIAEKNINSILYNMELLPFDMKGLVLGHSFKIGKTMADLKQINSIVEWREEQAKKV